MSAASSWSYTRKATHWARLTRDDWTGVATYAAPKVFACDYSAEAVRMTDAAGVEFTTRQIIYTEKADIKPQDFVLIGESIASTPVAAGAFQVRAVTRYSDTFDRKTDDWKVAT